MLDYHWEILWSAMLQIRLVMPMSFWLNRYFNILFWEEYIPLLLNVLLLLLGGLSCAFSLFIMRHLTLH